MLSWLFYRIEGRRHLGKGSCEGRRGDVCTCVCGGGERPPYAVGGALELCKQNVQQYTTLSLGKINTTRAAVHKILEEDPRR